MRPTEVRRASAEPAFPAPTMVEPTEPTAAMARPTRAVPALSHSSTNDRTTLTRSGFLQPRQFRLSAGRRQAVHLCGRHDDPAGHVRRFDPDDSEHKPGRAQIPW